MLKTLFKIDNVTRKQNSLLTLAVNLPQTENTMIILTNSVTGDFVDSFRNSIDLYRRCTIGLLTSNAVVRDYVIDNDDYNILYYVIDVDLW